MTVNYYQKHKEKLQEEARKRYQNLSEEEKEKRRNENLFKEEKKKLAEYRRNYYLTHKKQLLRDFVDFSIFEQLKKIH